MRVFVLADNDFSDYKKLKDTLLELFSGKEVEFIISERNNVGTLVELFALQNNFNLVYTGYVNKRSYGKYSHYERYQRVLDLLTGKPSVVVAYTDKVNRKLTNITQYFIDKNITVYTAYCE